jgi:type II secretory pathway component GspD/PulD (secretin)
MKNIGGFPEGARRYRDAAGALILLMAAMMLLISTSAAASGDDSAADIRNDSLKAAGSVLNSSSIINLNIKDADIRDVLSVLAMNGGKNIVYIGEPVKVTAKLGNVPADEAFEFVLRASSMSRIDLDYYVVVGKKEALNATFSDQLAATSFSLKYITSDVLITQIKNLNLNCRVISADTNKNTVWIQGYPDELVHVRRLISMLDKNENLTLGSREIANNFNPVILTYISGLEFSRVLSQLQLPAGFVLETNPSTVYIYAGVQDFEQIEAIRNIVDVVENYSGDGSYAVTQRFEKVALSYVTKDTVQSVISSFGLGVDVITSGGFSKAVWLQGSADNIIKAKGIIQAIDTAEASAINSFRVYRLYSVTAAEMEARLRALDISDIAVYTYSFPQFGRQLLVGCSSDYFTTVAGIISSLDVAAAAVTLPVDASEAIDGRARLDRRRSLISEMSGIAPDNFKISGNISKTENPRYILYLTAAPEEIQRVRDIIAEIDSAG